MCSRKRLTFIKDFINNESVCHFMVVQFCTMYENCKFLSMGYISALTQASVLI